MLNKIICVLTAFAFSACGDVVQDKDIVVRASKVTEFKNDPRTGVGMSADALKARSDAMTKALINAFGEQEAFAMLGWHQAPSYKPMEHCFRYWYDVEGTKLDAEKIQSCEEHVRELSRLYASYGVDAAPVIFKSEYYWDRRFENALTFTKRVKEWKAAGGTKEDASYLNHPVCAKPLQTGWTGSDYFYDGRESPICATFKLEAKEAKEAE